MTVKLSASVLAIAAVSATTAMARDNVQVTGSSTVLPYSTIVAEAFGENFDFPTPVVEGGGSGAGRAKMCEGVGTNTVDIANSSSRITQKDLDTCAASGVTEVMEVRFGYDGIVFASDVNGPAFAFTPADIYNALAAQVVVDGAIVANPHSQWVDFNSEMPAQDILVLSPGTKHGTREVYDERVIYEGCKATGAYDLFLAVAEGEDARADAGWCCAGAAATGGSSSAGGSREVCFCLFCSSFSSFREASLANFSAFLPTSACFCFSAR